MFISQAVAQGYPSIRDTGADLYRLPKCEVEWVAPSLSEVLDGSASGDEVVLPSTGEIVKDQPFAVPDMAWTAQTKKRLQTLISKAAVQTITPDEAREMRNLQALRRTNTPSRTYDELVRTAERDRLVNNLKNALETYVHFVQQ
ncbi:MAG: hypothetical protein FWF12_12710 [Betaproteobacteria bacterium]|nr:hypothetical protein [Betaproteobacteria bacterium]